MLWINSWNILQENGKIRIFGIKYGIVIQETKSFNFINMEEKEMGKHETMVKQNKERSICKENTAISLIERMVQEDQQVVVSELVKKTGFSRSFFYNNDRVRTELEKAQKLQNGKSFNDSRKIVIDKVMDKENNRLKKKLADQDKIISDLVMENNKLRKALENKNLKTINDL